MAIRSASAQWQGTLTEGTGTLRTGRGGLEGNYSFKSRFADGEGTNPEELIGAAHAACFSMAMSKGLADAGYPPNSVQTTANVHLEPVNGQQTVSRIDLVTVVAADGLGGDDLAKIAEATKANCPISRLLAPGTEITLLASLA